jgi:homogentisate 1,2-dioxygenase
MAREFSMQRGTTRVVFGAGSMVRLADEVAALGVSRALVVCSPRRREDASAIAVKLGARAAGVLAIAREHVPIDVANEARREAEKLGADAVVALGGGSAIGLAKAMAIASGARVVAIPTTYSGSEMTPVYGLTEAAEKKTGRDERARPALVVYDPTLTRGLPRDTTITSLWNAMAHATEALWLPIDRATRLAAEEALRLAASAALRLAVREDDDAREDALEAACLAGGVFADAGAGIHHKLCHFLGGAFALPHAATHAVVLPNVARLQRSHADAMAAIARALGVVDPIAGLDRLAIATGAPRSLAKLGMPREGIERAADALLAQPAFRSFERAALVAAIERAWSGPPEVRAATLRAPEDFATQPGFGALHESEALAGALPRRQNTPRPAPHGLYPEYLNATPFTVRSAEASRVWLYRVRPSFSHGAYEPLPHARFAAPLGDVDPNRTRWRAMPIPEAPASVDFVDGLVTIGGAGEATGVGYAVHGYAANADMSERAFSNADGDMLVVPQLGTLDVRTELGWLRVPRGSVLVVPRAIKFSIGVPEGRARGWVLEVFGRPLRLPERGPIGSNGLADARHFRAPVAAYEDRIVEGGFRVVHKTGGRLFVASQPHSPFDVVAWQGNHAPCTYDLSLFNAMGSVTFDHADPSILTVLTAPLDDHGRAIADFVVFPPRWDAAEHSFRPPYMHRNAASEINMVVRNAGASDYEEGCTFVSPLLTSHGITTKGYDAALDPNDAHGDGPRRVPDESLWVMFESALPFRTTAWARETPLVDEGFRALFEGMPSRFVL